MKKIENNASSIRAAIKSVVGRAGTLQNDIHKVAVACLRHTHEHGDWTLAVELVEGITRSAGVRASQLTKYFEAFMGATLTADEEGTKKFVYDEGRSAKDIDMAQAELVKWYDFKTPKVERELDIAEAIAKLAKQIGKAKAVTYSADEIAEAMATLQGVINHIASQVDVDEELAQELAA